MIGLLERHGLKERASAWIQIRSATARRLLIVYLFVREAAALGLTSLGGHPHCARCCADGGGGGGKALWPAAGQCTLPPARAMSAATDNVGLFFGEDIFVAFSAIIFMRFMLESGGIRRNRCILPCEEVPDGDLRLCDPRRAPVA